MEQECEERRAEVGRATWQQDDMYDTEREEGASGASARRQCRACVTPCPEESHPCPALSMRGYSEAILRFRKYLSARQMYASSTAHRIIP